MGHTSMHSNYTADDEDRKALHRNLSNTIAERLQHIPAETLSKLAQPLPLHNLSDYGTTASVHEPTANVQESQPKRPSRITFKLKGQVISEGQNILGRGTSNASETTNGPSSGKLPPKQIVAKIRNLGGPPPSPWRSSPSLPDSPKDSGNGTLGFSNEKRPNTKSVKGPIPHANSPPQIKNSLPEGAFDVEPLLSPTFPRLPEKGSLADEPEAAKNLTKPIPSSRKLRDPKFHEDSRDTSRGLSPSHAPNQGLGKDSKANRTDAVTGVSGPEEDPESPVRLSSQQTGKQLPKGQVRNESVDVRKPAAQRGAKPDLTKDSEDGFADKLPKSSAVRNISNGSALPSKAESQDNNRAHSPNSFITAKINGGIQLVDSEKPSAGRKHGKALDPQESKPFSDSQHPREVKADVHRGSSPSREDRVYSQSVKGNQTSVFDQACAVPSQDTTITNRETEGPNLANVDSRDEEQRAKPNRRLNLGDSAGEEIPRAKDIDLAKSTVKSRTDADKESFRDDVESQRSKDVRITEERRRSQRDDHRNSEPATPSKRGRSRSAERVDERHDRALGRGSETYARRHEPKRDDDTWSDRDRERDRYNGRSSERPMTTSSPRKADTDRSRRDEGKHLLSPRSIKDGSRSRKEQDAGRSTERDVGRASSKDSRDSYRYDDRDRRRTSPHLHKSSHEKQTTTRDSRDGRKRDGDDGRVEREARDDSRAKRFKYDDSKREESRERRDASVAESPRLADQQRAEKQLLAGNYARADAPSENTPKDVGKAHAGDDTQIKDKVPDSKAAPERTGMKIGLNNKRKSGLMDQSSIRDQNQPHASPSPGGRPGLPPSGARIREKSLEQSADPDASERRKAELDRSKAGPSNTTRVTRWHTQGKSLKDQADDMNKKWLKRYDAWSIEFQGLSMQYFGLRVMSASKFCLWGCARGESSVEKSGIPFAEHLYRELLTYRDEKCKEGTESKKLGSDTRQMLTTIVTSYLAVLSRIIAVTWTRSLRLLKGRMEKILKETKTSAAGQAHSPANAQASRAKITGHGNDTSAPGVTCAPDTPDSVSGSELLADCKLVTEYTFKWLNAWERVAKVTSELDSFVGDSGKVIIEVAQSVTKIGTDGGLQDLDQVEHKLSVVMKSIQKHLAILDSTRALPAVHAVDTFEAEPVSNIGYNGMQDVTTER